MLGRRLTESEFSQAYGLLFQDKGSVQECLLRVRSLDHRGLKQVYRRRAQETHPDRAHLRVTPAPVNPEEEFRSVVAAYELLKLVQQGAVDVHVIARPAPRPAAASASSRAAADDAWRQARDQARRASEARARAAEQARASRRAAATERTQREPSRAYADRSGQRARAWGQFWGQSAATSKFNPDSEHYFEQQVPHRQLPLGQFLYYSGAISWRQLIDALVWQRQQRPMIGQIAREWGMLTEQQVREVLERRRASGRYDTKFADFAEEIGMLSAREKMALCGRMKMLQKPLGQYFVTEGIFSAEQLNELLTAHRRHNWRAQQRRNVAAW